MEVGVLLAVNPAAPSQRPKTRLGTRYIPSSPILFYTPTRRAVEQEAPQKLYYYAVNKPYNMISQFTQEEPGQVSSEILLGSIVASR